MHSSDRILEMRDISKDFSGVQALDRVSFSVERASIHALCGENGAGKSTLMKILAGYYPCGSYNGEILIHGKPQDLRGIRDSEKAGIAIIYQELSLVPEMSISENIFLGREPRRFGIIDWDRTHFEAQKALGTVGLRVSSRTLVKDLGVGQQQLVEIAKALSQKPEILVLDEPTSALTKTEIQTLLEILRRLRIDGISCILISHKLDEVLSIADHITVLRDGKTVKSCRASETTENQIIKDMVGRELTDLYPEPSGRTGDVVFAAKNLSTSKPHLDKISFSVKKGEIVGIAGLMGAGRTELLMAIFGALPTKISGEILIEGKQQTFASPRAAIKAGLALLTEDRKRFGLVLEDSVLKNMTLSHLAKLSRFGLINTAEERSTARKYEKLLRVKTSSLETPIKNLSGGNQQKAVLAKCLMTNPKVLFLDEPTRGIDVGAKAEIYHLIRRLAAEGLAIVIVSSELPEIIGMSDRVLVMRQGQMVALSGDVTQESIMTAALAQAGAA